MKWVGKISHTISMLLKRIRNSSQIPINEGSGIAFWFRQSFVDSSCPRVIQKKRVEVIKSGFFLLSSGNCLKLVFFKNRLWNIQTSIFHLEMGSIQLRRLLFESIFYFLRISLFASNNCIMTAVNSNLATSAFYSVPEWKKNNEHTAL